MQSHDIETNKEKTTIAVQIPAGAVPGGSFDYTTASGKTILVKVPQNAVPGGYVDVVVDEDDDDEEIQVSFKRSTVGAAFAGTSSMRTCIAQKCVLFRPLIISFYEIQKVGLLEPYF